MFMFNKDCNLIYEQYKILSEVFRHPSDMFSDPKNNHLSWDEIMKQFEDEGGSIIGTGKQGTVLQHPDWPYIIKFFEYDNSYIRFVRFANKHPNVCFPKFYGNPQLIVPNFKRSKKMEALYLVRMEYIPYGIRNQEDKHFILNVLERTEDYFNIEGDSYVRKYLKIRNKPKEERTEDENYFFRSHVAKTSYERYLKSQEIARERPEFVRLSKAFDMLRNAGLFNDIHENNIRRRENGEYVVIDPAWDYAYQTPEAIHNELMARETGAYLADREDYIPEPLLPGGKMFDRRKAKREEKRLKRELQKEYETTQPDDDIPF